ncbi:MAG: enolase [Patescibacteria group bacterium]|jgi:enolase
MFIKNVNNKIILNSRKEKTIEITLTTYEGKFTCSAPSGKSKGASEVPSYNPKGVEKSLDLLNGLSKHLIHKNFIIKEIDDLLQLNALINAFEKRYSSLGGNITYILHGVFLKAAAKDNNKELWKFIFDDIHKETKSTKIQIPMPIGNVIGGGLHSKPINGKTPDIQEFHYIPKEETMSKAMTVNIKAYSQLKKIIKAKSKNDENAWETSLTNEEILEAMQETAKKYKLRIGLDVAANSFYKNDYYKYTNKALIRDRLDQIDYMIRLVKKYNIFYLEDPMQEEDFSGFKSINESTPKATLVTGDDLTTTNLKRTNRATRVNAINAIIIKPNQIGSLIEVKKVVQHCNKNNITMIFSHRSAETMDNILADYCIGFSGSFIKTGVDGKERLIKLKRVIDIEKQIQKIKK